MLPGTFKSATNTVASPNTLLSLLQHWFQESGLWEIEALMASKPIGTAITTLALRHDSFVSWLIRAATDEEGVKDVA